MTTHARLVYLGLGAAVAVGAVALLYGGAIEAEAEKPAETTPPAGAFASTTIDIGVVTSDVAKAARFYTEAIGFKEVPGFDVSPEMGRDSGLADGKAFSVRVFVLGNGPAATKLKLMQVPGAPGAKPDNAFIHSTLGLSYLTVFVSDMTASVERLAKAGVKPLAKGPLALGSGNFLTVVRDPDGNFVELVGRMR